MTHRRLNKRRGSYQGLPLLPRSRIYGEVPSRVEGFNFLNPRLIRPKKKSTMDLFKV